MESRVASAPSVLAAEPGGLTPPRAPVVFATASVSKRTFSSRFLTKVSQHSTFELYHANRVEPAKTPQQRQVTSVAG